MGPSRTQSTTIQTSRLESELLKGYCASNDLITRIIITHGLWMREWFFGKQLFYLCYILINDLVLFLMIFDDFCIADFKTMNVTIVHFISVMLIVTAWMTQVSA